MWKNLKSSGKTLQSFACLRVLERGGLELVDGMEISTKTFFTKENIYFFLQVWFSIIYHLFHLPKQPCNMILLIS